MSGSRGCYARCTFCDIKSFYKNGRGPGWRGRSPANILHEMRIIQRRYGKDLTFSFVDDQFIGPGKKGYNQAVEFANLLLKSGGDFAFEITCRADTVERDLFALLKKAGLHGVYIGIDSGSPKGLEHFRKDLSMEDNLRAIKILNALKIPVDLGFIMFEPLMSLNDLQHNIDFLRKVSFSGVFINPAAILNSLSLYPETPIISQIPNASEYHFRLNGFECQSSLFLDQRVAIIRDALKRYWTFSLKSHFQSAEQLLENSISEPFCPENIDRAKSILLHSSEFLLDLLEELTDELQSIDVTKHQSALARYNLIIRSKTENLFSTLKDDMLKGRLKDMIIS